MYTQNDGAWVKNAAEEAQMVEAMRKGADLVVKSMSARGTKTTDTYSLKGIARRSTRWPRSASRARAPYIAVECRIYADDGLSYGKPRSTPHQPRAIRREDAARALCGAGQAVAGRAVARASLAEALGEIGVPEAQRKMRVQQLWHWIYVRGLHRVRRDDQRVEGAARGARRRVSRWRGPKSWPSRSRSTARANGCCGCRASVEGERPHEVECVYIPDTDRGTLCVSSQVGCTLNCSFCHTGTQRLVRNLTAGEIVGQVMVARDRLGDWPGSARADRWPRRRRPSASSPTS